MCPARATLRLPVEMKPGVTVSVVEAVSELAVAAIVVCPSPTAFVAPLPVTVATDVADELRHSRGRHNERPEGIRRHQ